MRTLISQLTYYFFSRKEMYYESSQTFRLQGYIFLFCIMCGEMNEKNLRFFSFISPHIMQNKKMYPCSEECGMAHNAPVTYATSQYSGNIFSRPPVWLVVPHRRSTRGIR